MTAASRNRYLFPALLVAVVFLLYGRSITFDFVNYDDYDLVVRNTEFLKDPGNILTSFTTHAFTTHREEGVYYRPILLLSYFADYALWGVNPAGFHLTNVLLHAVATLLLFLLAVELLRQARGAPANGEVSAGATSFIGDDRLTAFLTALLFAVHPVQTESVAWVAGRNDILLGVFILGSLCCHIAQYRPGARPGVWYAFSAALFAAALLTKESALFFLPLFPLYELTIRRESLTTLFATREKHIRVSVYLAIAVAYLGVRYNIFDAFIGTEKLYGKIPLDNRFLMAPGLALTSILFLIWPMGLNIVHPIENVPWFDWPAMLVAFAVSAGLIFLCVRYFRKIPLLAWSIGWLIVGLIPILNVFPLAVPILEHRLYTVTAGFAFAVAVGARHLGGSAGRSDGKVGSGRLGGLRIGNPAMAVIAAACIGLATLTWARLPVWRNSETLWLDAIRNEPNGARAYFNLAGYYFEQQRFDRTITLLETYVTLKPDDFTGFAKLRQSYFLAGRFADAAGVCRTLINQSPRNVSRYVEAGVLFERMGLSDSVIAVYEEGLRVDPSFFQLHGRLGAWYRTRGNTGKAAWHLRAADSLARNSTLPQ